MAADRRLMKIIQTVQRKLDEHQARDGRRPVLRGEAQPGNSWDDYLKAIAELKAVKEADLLGSLLSKDSKTDPAVGERVLAEHGIALEHLQRGASRAASLSTDWNRSNGRHYYVTSAAQLKARALLKEGKVRECIGLLLDLCQFGRDIAETGPTVWESLGMICMSGAWDEIHSVMASGKLTRPEFDELGRGLETLDQSYPSHSQAVERDFLISAQEMIPVCESGVAWGRLMGVGSLEHQLEWVERAAQAEARGWTEVQTLAREIEGEAERSWNPLVKMLGKIFLQNAYHHRSARARLRLLRIEVHWRATGEILDLEDPFGGRLKHVVKDGALRAWSVGKDGADDGGDGEWTKAGKDIVVEIGR